VRRFDTGVIDDIDIETESGKLVGRTQSEQDETLWTATLAIDIGAACIESVPDVVGVLPDKPVHVEGNGQADGSHPDQGAEQGDV
jgi:hypothetical protein